MKKNVKIECVGLAAAMIERALGIGVARKGGVEIPKIDGAEWARQLRELREALYAARKGSPLAKMLNEQIKQIHKEREQVLRGTQAEEAWRYSTR